MKKGIVLAGGSGSRLHPFTSLINKHLLPVYNKPMIYYPIQLLIKSGIKEIAVVVNDSAQLNQISKLIDNEQSVVINYIIQEAPKGTGHALSLCQAFTEEQPFMVIWGDNIIEYNLLKVVEKYNDSMQIFIKKVGDLSNYGEVLLNEKFIVKQILYATKKPIQKEGYALTGIFLFNQAIFKYIDQIKRNLKGEFDIVDALILAKYGLGVEKLQGYWIDAASSFENLVTASVLVREKGSNKNR